MLEASEPAEVIDRIRQQLSSVIDPEIGRDVLEMGLIYLIEAGPAGNVHIMMTTTTKGCPASAFLKDAVRACAGSVTGVTNVDVELTYDPPWNPSMMAP